MKEMRGSVFAQFFIGLILLLAVRETPAQLPVQKSNPLKVYMHYMPWFETPETIGKWGWHWTMNTRNPEIIEAGGRRQIASHYYPLIGPYASRDKDVIEYHLLLMKLSGIDGVLVNWYGTVGSNGDVKDLLKSSDSIISYTDDFGLEFAVVMEDRFSRSVDDVKANMAYLRNNYFTRPEYIRMGPDENPLVCIFGPITFEDPDTWTNIMPSAGEELEFLTLWYESGDAGVNADGEFSWVYQDNLGHLTHLDNFYNLRAPQQKTVMGSAYPGFNDYYEEGGAGSGYFYIPHYFGSTLSETLNRAGAHQEEMDMLQLVTFNDFGEGTMFEPTYETGYDYLNQVQQFTGVSYGKEELILVHRLYVLRKDYAGDSDIQEQLDQASIHLRNLEIDEASAILMAITPITGTQSYVPEDEVQGRLIQSDPLTGELLLPGLPPAGNVLNLTIYNLHGQIVKKEILAESGSPVSYSPGLPQGFYILRVENAAAEQTVRLLIR